MTDLAQGVRNADLSDLAEMLRTQQARKLDVVAPAHTIRARGGSIWLHGTEAEITDDGVTPTAGEYRPTATFNDGIASKLGIPTGYLKRLHAERSDLYDQNVNGWLHGRVRHGEDGKPEIVHPADPRKFLVRTFRGNDGPGIARAFLSDRFGIIDHLDVLMAALDGVRSAGTEVVVDGCDLTDDRMYVRVAAPGISAYAPELLAGYRSPFDGRSIGGGWTPEAVARAAGHEGKGYAPGTEPIVFAGFVISNSETGGGAFTLTPRLTVKVCRNGLTVTADAQRAVHLGEKLSDGVVRWSVETQQKQLALITSKTADAVRSFLDVEYVTARVADLTAKAGVEITDAPKTVELIAKKLAYTEEQRTTILDFFIKGGQLTAGGVMQAVTAAAQTFPADAAAQMEADAIMVLTLAASK